MMKQTRGLDRNNVLRPTPGDLRGVEQHHWNAGANENQTGGPSNRQKSSDPNQDVLSSGKSIYIHVS